MKKPDNFNDVQHPVLRAYNRAVTALTLHQEEGEVPTRQYFDQFEEDERKAIAVMLMSIKADPEETKKRVGAVAYATSN